MGTKLSNKIIEKIEGEKIAPTPRWQFKLHDILLWVFFAISILVGSLACSTILHTFFSNDWGAYAQIRKSLFEFVFLSIPYFWIIILAVFLALAYLDFKSTREGFKFRSIWIVLLSLGLSFIFGTFLWWGGMGEKTDRIFEGAPLLRNFDLRQHLWNNPLENTLMGVITKVSEESIEIKDPAGTIWKVDISSLSKIPEFEVGERIRIVGEKKSEKEFKAKIVWPMHPPMFRGRFQNFEMPSPNLNEINNFDTRMN
jgi:hypothetical protein